MSISNIAGSTSVHAPLSNSGSGSAAGASAAGQSSLSADSLQNGSTGGASQHGGAGSSQMNKLVSDILNVLEQLIKLLEGNNGDGGDDGGPGGAKGEQGPQQSGVAPGGSSKGEHGHPHHAGGTHGGGSKGEHGRPQHSGGGAPSNGGASGGGAPSNGGASGGGAPSSGGTSGGGAPSNGGASGGGNSGQNDSAGTSTSGSGNISNITFHGGTPQQQAQVKQDYQKLMAAEGPYMDSSIKNQHVDVYFDNTGGGLTTSGGGPGAKIELNSNLSGSSLDAVAGHEFNNAYASRSLDNSLPKGPNSQGYYASEYIGDALMRHSLGLPEDSNGQKVISEFENSPGGLTQAYQAFFGTNTAQQQQLAKEIEATGVYNI